MAETTLEPVPTPHVPIVWPSIADLVGAACERSYGKFTADLLFNEISGDRMQLWLAWDGGPQAVCITRTLDVNGVKILDFVIVTGVARETWQHFKHQIEDWARSIGCTRSQAMMRPGWSKIFPDFKITHFFGERAL